MLRSSLLSVTMAIVALSVLAAEPADPAGKPASAPAATTATKAVANLADEPEWWNKKIDYVKTADKLLQDYKSLPDYVEAMKKVHAKFTGTPGTLAMFGASQTGAREFWSPLSDKTIQKNMPPQMQKDYDLVNSYMKPECWKWKGGTYGNTGGMSTAWVNETACGEVLKRLNPEVVVLLIGQGDMDLQLKNDGQYEEWKKGLTEACQKCLDNGSVLIMSTFPPRASRHADVYNEGILQIAAKLKVPVTDWGGECIKRSPTDWNGSAPEVRAKYNYVPDPKNKAADLEVPTLICFDGQHASYPAKYANDWSEESLRCSGNNLRTYITLAVYADVLRKVLNVPQPPAAQPATGR